MNELDFKIYISEFPFEDGHLHSIGFRYDKDRRHRCFDRWDWDLWWQRLSFWCWYSWKVLTGKREMR